MAAPEAELSEPERPPTIWLIPDKFAGSEVQLKTSESTRSERVNEP